jgi:hypothetical protein
MADEAFITRQSSFLQAAIREYLAAVAVHAVKEVGDAAG